MMKLLIFFPGVLFLSIALVSCSLPKVKEGKLKVEADGLIADIEEQGGFESANIRWQTLATNDSAIYNIEITLLNGSKFPDLDSVTEQTGKRFAKMVFDAMTNANEFDSFTVIFVDETNFIIGSSSRSEVFEFKPEDLK